MLRQNQAIKFLGLSPPFLYFKDSSFTQIQQKRPSQTPVLARFWDRYAPISIKYLPTEPKTGSFQKFESSFESPLKLWKSSKWCCIRNFTKRQLSHTQQRRIENPVKHLRWTLLRKWLTIFAKKLHLRGYLYQGFKPGMKFQLIKPFPSRTASKNNVKIKLRLYVETSSR